MNVTVLLNRIRVTDTVTLNSWRAGLLEEFYLTDDVSERRELTTFYTLLADECTRRHKRIFNDDGLRRIK